MKDQHIVKVRPYVKTRMKKAEDDQISFFYSDEYYNNSYKFKKWFNIPLLQIDSLLTMRS